MKKQTIKKSVAINASKEKVWDVLTNDRMNRIWYAEFSEGSHAETNWNEGSKAIFKDDSNCGLIGQVVSNHPNELLSVEYSGVLTAGKEDYESDEAVQVKGGREVYQLTQKNGVTQLDVACDMAESYYDQMNVMWDKAMVKIKELAEGVPEKN